MNGSKDNKVAKAGVAYTVGNYLIKGIGIITVPLFARLMSTSDFGIYNSFLAYESILYIFISLTLHGSLKSASYRFKDSFDDYVSSVQIMPIGLFVLLLISLVLFKGSISILLGLDEVSLILLVIYSYCSGVMIYYRGRIALDYDYKEYIRLSVFNVLFSVILSVVLMFTLLSECRYLGRIIGGTVSYVLIALYVLIKIFKKSKPKLNKSYWKYGLLISLPLIPHGLSQILLLQFDRIMISNIVGNSEAGLYSFAYTIFSLVQITGSSLETVYSPWVFKKIHQENDIDSVRRIGTCFIMFIAGVVITITMICPEIIVVMGGEKYRSSIFCAVPVMLSGFFSMAYCVPAVMEYYHEKTSYIAIGTSIAAILNIVLNIVFINLYGYIAAAYTTLVCYILYFVLHTIISRKLSGFWIIKIKGFSVSVILLSISFVLSLYFVDYWVIRLFSLILMLSIGLFFLVKEYGVSEAKKMVIKILSKKGRKQK